MTPLMVSTCERLVGEHFDAELGAKIYFKGQDIPDGASTYVRFFVVASPDTYPMGLGMDAKKRNIGLLQMNCYGPRSKGGGKTHRIAHELWKFLTRREFEVLGEGMVVLKEGAVLDMDIIGEEYLHIVRVPYRYDFKIED